MRGKVIGPGVVQTKLNGKSVLFSNALGRVIGTKLPDGRWQGPCDSGGTIIAQSAIGLRTQQAADAASCR